MLERDRVPTAYRNCSISVVTEQLPHGRWAVVVTVTHSTERAQQPRPLPVFDQTFASQEAAREFGLQAGQRWIDENMPASG